MLNLLANKVDKMPEVLGGLYTFVLGMVVIFLGITIIVLFVSLAGKILNKSESKTDKKQSKAEVKPVVETVVEVADDGEIPDHIKVAIVAAITAYYEEAKSNCDFVVKKIRRF